MLARMADDLNICPWCGGIYRDRREYLIHLEEHHSPADPADEALDDEPAP